MRVLEVEDEHAEARFVAAEIAALVEEGYSGSEIAVFYRTNAQSRVLEDVLVRQGIAYQVIGGPRFYERAEIKDAIAYLQVIDNPYDAVSLDAHREPAAARDRRHVARAPRRRSPTRRGSRSGRRSTAPRRPASRGAPLRAVQALRTLLAVAHGRRAGADRRPSSLERVLERSGYLEALEAERTIEAQGRIENLQELVGVAREYAGRPRPSRRSPAFLQEISLYSDQDALRGEDEPRHADDAAQREGPRVPRRLPDRRWRRGSSRTRARSRSRGIEEERRLCYVGMTRAKERLTLTHASSRVALGQPRATTCPSRFLDELPEQGVERERLRPASWSATARRAALRSRRARTSRRSRPATPCGTTTLGEGVVTRIEPGGVVTVRFAGRQRAAADARLRAARADLAGPRRSRLHRPVSGSRRGSTAAGVRGGAKGSGQRAGAASGEGRGRVRPGRGSGGRVPRRADRRARRRLGR